MTYDDMLDTLLSGKLPECGFGHAEHLGTAHAALRRWEFFEAAHRYSTALRKVTTDAGVPEKYNATVTLCFLSTVAERMGEEDSADFVDSASGLDGTTLARAGYDSARLAHPKARSVGLLPRRM